VGPSDLNLPNAWKKTLGTNKLIIAIADSGIWFDHPDLKGNFWTASDGSHGINFVGSTATDLSKCIPTNTNAADDYGHGTAVAGVVGATINNGVGIVGTAQEQIMSVKILDNKGNGSDASTACGIQWAADHGANVIAISSGCLPNLCPGGTPMEQSAVTYAWGKGALIIASAGNEATNVVECPACYSQVIAVSALQQGDSALDPNSNFGNKVELSAPGNNIYTTFWTGATDQTDLPKNCFVQNLAQSYCYHGGTSFAAPFVAGIAALAWDYNFQQGTLTRLTNQQIRDALDAYVVSLSCSSCKPKPDALLLLNNMVSTHPYTLTAHWQFFSSSGTENKAQVWVYDVYTSQALSGWLQVGNGLTLNIMPGHSLDVQYNGCFNDGSNNVKIDHVQSSGGPPSGSVPFAQPFTWTMGAIPASTDAIYYVVFSC
jgi:subtilisin family serine protease